LEKAVEVLMADLRKNPPPAYKRPPFPNYRKSTGGGGGSSAG